MSTNVGVLGLEAVHEWNGSLRLNAPRDEGYPRYVLHRIGGLYSKADGDVTTDPLLGYRGERPRPSTDIGKTVVYEGEVQALSLLELRAGMRNLLAAFEDRAIGTMHVIPDAGWTDGGTEHYFTGTPTACDIDDVQEAAPTRMPSPYVRSFTVSIRQHDPRYYEVTSRTAGPTAATLTVTNGGSLPTDPVLTLTATADVAGPWSISRSDPGTDPELAFVEDLVDGDIVIVDFAAHTAKRAGISLTLGPDPTWWDTGVAGLRPGSNTITAPADVTIAAAWRDAS